MGEPVLLVTGPQRETKEQSTMAGKKGGKQRQFEFEYQSKKYIIHGRYDGQPTTLVLSDGHILQVSVWEIGVPFKPLPDRVEPFDPQQTMVTELAKLRKGFVAELVQDRKS